MVTVLLAAVLLVAVLVRIVPLVIEGSVVEVLVLL